MYHFGSQKNFPDIPQFFLKTKNFSGDTYDVYCHCRCLFIVIPYNHINLNHDRINLNLVGAPNCRGPLVLELTLTTVRYATALAPEFFQKLVSNSQNEPTITITAGDVFEKLSKLNPRKAHGPDGIPTWVLKENADILELPVKNILNCSYREWKEADIVAISKKKPITDINNHLRPMTPILSNLAEDFVVERHLKPAVLARIDKRQFGSIPNSSTKHALISMLHSWNTSTDSNGSTNRVMLFNFSKAFDMIDHRILSVKLTNLLRYPQNHSAWILDFITGRSQRVKLRDDCVSEWKTVSKLGPWLFPVMMNDLNVAGDASLWKYVNDSTCLKLSTKINLVQCKLMLTNSPRSPESMVCI